MDKLGRLLAILTLAVFAAWTIAHAAGSTSMSLAMSPAAVAGHMGDCDNCPPADDGMDQTCGQLCLAPFGAIPAAAGVELSFRTGDSVMSRTEEIVGRTGPPDPYPPRTSHLS